MEALNLQAMIALSGGIITVGSAYLTIKKIAKEQKKERTEEAAKILQDAKEDIALFNTKLEAEIESLRHDLDNFKESVEKDFNHIRETYNGEIRNLGQKIEDLRTELRNQHGQLVQLLSKMIDNRD